MEQDNTDATVDASGGRLFDGWFDPIETDVRAKVRGFGPTEITVPRARLVGEDGKTKEWKSQALRASAPNQAADWDCPDGVALAHFAWITRRGPCVGGGDRGPLVRSFGA